MPKDTLPVEADTSLSDIVPSIIPCKSPRVIHLVHNLLWASLSLSLGLSPNTTSWTSSVNAFEILPPFSVISSRRSFKSMSKLPEMYIFVRFRTPSIL